MSVQIYLGYVLASVVVLAVPGPTVSLIIANSLKYGTRAGLLNIAGTQVGLSLMLGVLLLGLKTVMALMGVWFDWIRLLGALYLVWLGVKMLTVRERPNQEIGAASLPGQGFFWQGLGVALSNPKVLLFFGAFIPQFIDPGKPYAPQVLLLVTTFMALAVLMDGGYAVLAGRAGAWLTGRRRLWMSRGSGLILIGGGIWLALLRR